ncbi:hypothetical protein RO3G_13648 [Rhizopus delemar RA 99-880]|uniref:non-specific serine/threonine protein kinase n=1 Tax=Rhizopus delemar (strain RA 99-880 / ATCC MYA-4621 / FGSC 9543 / NRRL 43880) TaxID=246409 RepID=I1CKF7_RHIO9|nr:hypothetical protein RO3G_13648 [Rhizopus delemar RA 99-880]|eukprot:EIE88937.1 hypothetical protein RO3G_13648 [Rhizopus delemar RA 99-880]
MSNSGSESDYSDVESIQSDEEEYVEDYKKGGYHPVQLGDRFDNGRYIICRKLGWGHFSTVWLAFDTLQDRHVALKIVKSAHRYTESALEEIKLLESVRSTNSASKGWQHVAQLLNYFWHEGPHGKHACMTFEVLGESLLSLMKRYNYKGIPQPIVKRIAKQVLEGLDYLHRECGIVHTDLKPENVLVWIPDIEEYLRKETADVLRGEYKEQPKSLLENVDTTGMSKNRKKRLKKKLKKQQQQQQSQNEDGVDEIEGKMQQLKVSHKVMSSSVLDFAAIISEKNKEKDAFSDIVVKIADLGEFLFDPRAGSKYNKDDDHLAQILELLRTVPRALTTGGEFSREFFDRSGKLKHIKKLRYRRLRDVLHDTFLVPPEDADAISAFLLPMLEMDITKRASASQMLENEWLKDV